MKKFANRLTRFLWQLTGPVRHPISRKASALIHKSTERAISESVHPALGEMLVGVAMARREVGTYRNETNLLLDSLVREVTRLQDEVASLRAELVASDLPATILINADRSSGRDLAESA